MRVRSSYFMVVIAMIKNKRRSFKDQAFRNPNLTGQGLLNLNMMTERWMLHVEKAREGRILLACLGCGGLGWFYAPGLCPGCTKRQDAQLA